MPRAKELIGTPIAELIAQGWEHYTPAYHLTTWPQQARVEVITRGGRRGYALSRLFWWGRHAFDAARDNATMNEKRRLPPPHPTTLAFHKGDRQPHNEIIAWRHYFNPIVPGAGAWPVYPRPAPSTNLPRPSMTAKIAELLQLRQKLVALETTLLDALFELDQILPQPGGAWIEHDGTACPFPHDTLVELKIGADHQLHPNNPLTAISWEWIWPEGRVGRRVTTYRLAKPTRYENIAE